MECHKCKHRAAIEAGEFRGVAFEQTPCAQCDGSVSERYALLFQELSPTDETLSPEPSVPDQAFPEEEPAAPLLPVSALVIAVEAILSLPELDLQVLKLKRKGYTHTEIGNAMGFGQRAIACRFNRVLMRCPVLAALFPERQQWAGRKRAGSNA